MEHFKKVFAHDEVTVALNTDNEKYWNYETSTGIFLEMYACAVMTVVR